MAEKRKWTIPETEVHRSRPDIVVYVPADPARDGLNEHFLVFEGPGDSLMAVWTQSHRVVPGRPDKGQKNRILFAVSRDEGRTWGAPRRIVGPADGDDESCFMASWAFPMVTDRGRIYVVYSQHAGKTGWCPMHTGIMCGVYSDDAGETWSSPGEIPFARGPYDDPGGETPPEWIVWQRPMRDDRGRFLAPYTRWVHKSRAALSPEFIRGRNATWTWWESVCEVMRFTNLQEHPELRDVAIAYPAWGGTAWRVPHYLYPECSVAQEPSVVRLPDNRLFCVMRTNSGYLWHTLSEDGGDTWCAPRPLLYRDFGRPVLNPVGCAPIYRLRDGRYALFFSNHRGEADPAAPREHSPRDPVYLSVGVFRPGAGQPIEFGEPVVFMNSESTNVFGEKEPQPGFGLYSSFTTSTGRDLLWYPDRKCILLGKAVTP